MNERQASEPANDDDLDQDETVAIEDENAKDANDNDDIEAESEAEVEEGDEAAAEDEESDEANATDDAETAAETDEETDEQGEGGNQPVDPEVWQTNMRLVEALLFASSEPMTERVLANRLPEGADVKGLLRALQLVYEDRGVNLMKSGTSWAFRTSPDLAEYLNKEVEVARKLSRAAIETLAIVAYHQPVTRAEIEEIRGVSISKGTIDALLEEEWIRPRGRRQTPGRPLQWGTTDLFLDHFGIESLRDLPGLDELKAAGLLDASPAINAYRATAGIMDELPQEETEETDEDPLPSDPLDIQEDTDEEPLDPDDGNF